MSGKAQHFYKFEDFRLDTGERLLSRNGQKVALTPKAFDTLVYLVERTGHLVGKEELMQAIWPDSFVEEGNLTRLIHTLRKTLGEDDGRHLIETVPKAGYRFIPKVEENRADISRTDGRPGATNEPAKTYAKTRPTLFGLRPSIFWSIFVGLLLLGVLAWSTSRRHYFRGASIEAVGLKAITTSGNIGFPALSPDGRLLAFVRTEAGKPSLWMRQNSLRHSEIRLTEPKMDEIFTAVVFSPDGSKVYFLLKPRNNSVTRLYSVPILGGEGAKPVIDDVDSPPAFSPDGRQFAFMRRNTKEGVTALMVANNDGNELREVVRRTNPLDYLLKPLAWSPDGQELVCVGSQKIGSADRNLVLIDVAEGKEGLVSTEKWIWIDSIVWTKKKGIVFSASDPQKPLGLQLWAVDTLEGTPKRLTSDLNDYSDLSLAVDTGEISALQAQWESYVGLIDTTAPDTAQRVSPNKTDGSQGIAWTPDGDLIYTSVINSRNSLQRVSLGDMSTRAVTEDDKNVFRNPVISSDGRYIVYTSNQEQPESIWRMGIDGRDPKRLITISGDMAAVSPDGQTVYFSSSVEGQATIWSVPIDGGVPKKLSEKMGSRPKVSPDGQRIAFYYRSDAKAPWQIAIMQPETDKVSQLIDLPKTVSLSSQFSWSPDGTALILIDSRDVLNNLWRYPLDGKPPEQITRFVDDPFNRIVNFAYSPDGRQIALTRGRRISDAVSLNAE